MGTTRLLPSTIMAEPVLQTQTADAEPPGSSNFTNTATEDIQADFQSIKDALQKVKLPGDLRLNDT